MKLLGRIFVLLKEFKLKFSSGEILLLYLTVALFQISVEEGSRSIEPLEWTREFHCSISIHYLNVILKYGEKNP